MLFELNFCRSEHRRFESSPLAGKQRLFYAVCQSLDLLEALFQVVSSCFTKVKSSPRRRRRGSCGVWGFQAGRQSLTGSRGLKDEVTAPDRPDVHNERPSPTAPSGTGFNLLFSCCDVRKSTLKIDDKKVSLFFVRT